MRKYSASKKVAKLSVAFVCVLFIVMVVWTIFKGENTFVDANGNLVKNSASQSSKDAAKNTQANVSDNSKNSEGISNSSSHFNETLDKGENSEEKNITANIEPIWTAEQRSSVFFEEAMPILVNYENKIPEDFSPELTEVANGYSLDKNAHKAYIAMQKAAYADGINIWLVSAYRSTERQKQNFENKLREHIASGKTEEEAYIATSAYIAVPGTSEHSLGLAADINSLEESFENTKTFKWLYENCAKYGFILRYPKDKKDITKIEYEPWHYRYVGSNHAEIIMREKLCLEEYLSIYYNQK